MEKRTGITVLIVVLLTISLPFVASALAGGSDWVFGGFLLNPMDGASYLAKMRMGFDGAWRFTLPFTAQTSEGAYLFLFYLALGHLARILGAPLIVVYHLARVIGAALMVFALARFLHALFPAREDLRRAGLWMLCFGAGMGWLVVFMGPPPADFWVAEAYPFLSMYSNPHFPIGLALLLETFTTLLNGFERPTSAAPGIPGRLQRVSGLMISGLLVSIILPFGMVILLLVAAAWMVWELAAAPGEGRKERLLLAAADLAATGCLGGPFLLYQYWAALTDPLLRGWNAQNITPTPPAWNLLLSFAPAFLLAILWIWTRRKKAKNAGERLAITWFMLGIVLSVLPFALQRRFLLGLYIPITGLAIGGMDVLVQRWRAKKGLLWRLYFGLALPSTMLVMVIGLFGALGRSPLLYLAADEVRALDWIAENAPPGSLVAAAPATGQWIPGFTGRRVIYGHPYETVRAEEEEAWVTAVYRAPTVDLAVLEARGVDFFFYGPREREINPALDRSALDLVFDSPQAQVYAVGGEP